MTASEGMIDYIDISCSNCNIQTTKTYDPCIDYRKFVEERSTITCPSCNMAAADVLSCTPHFSNEAWRTTLLEKYQNLITIANENLPGLWDSLEFELSVQKILNISDCTLPFAGIVLGRPSSLKTVGIDLFRKWPNTYYTDSFSAKSMVSHSTAVKRDELEKIDMLPKIKNKLLLTPELSPTFSKKDDDLIDILGILTRILDGHGYESDTGAHGHRGYAEPIMFTWIGAAVDIPYKVHKILGNLGYKLYFLRLPYNAASEEKYCEELGKDFSTKLAKVQIALFEYLNYFEKGPELQKDEKTKLSKIQWAGDKDQKAAKGQIVKLAILLGHLRGVVPTWGDTEDTSGLGYAYALATIEDPSRAMTQLYNLARGHALSQGRNYITTEDIMLLSKVDFSTASNERVRAFELLIEFGGTLKTSEITESLNISAKTAKRIMVELKAVELVEVEDAKVEKTIPAMEDYPERKITVIEKQVVLVKKFHWCLKDRVGRKNTPYSHKYERKTGLEGKISPSVTLLKCPFEGCKFRNSNQDTIDHHFKYTHTDYIHDPK